MNDFRALTIRQPWANLIAYGEKQYETRPFQTSYRGPLVIHSGKAFDEEQIELVNREPFHSALERHNGTMNLPRGCAVAVANLVDIRPVEDTYRYLAEQERAFGDYAEGRYAWILDNVYRLPEPIPARGKQGIWRWQLPLPDAALAGIYSDILGSIAELSNEGFFHVDAGGKCVICDEVEGHANWCPIGDCVRLVGDNGEA